MVVGIVKFKILSSQTKMWTFPCGLPAQASSRRECIDNQIQGSTPYDRLHNVFIAKVINFMADCRK